MVADRFSVDRCVVSADVTVSRVGRLRESALHLNHNLFPSLLANRAAEGDKGATSEQNNCAELHWKSLISEIYCESRVEARALAIRYKQHAGVANWGNAPERLPHGPSGTQYQQSRACE